MSGDSGGLSGSYVGSWAGAAPLTWGQRHIWNQIQRLVPDDHFLNNSYPFRLPPRSSEEWAPGHEPTPGTVLRALAELVGLYETLRTQIRLVDGEPRQVIARTGQVRVEVVPSTAERAEIDVRTTQARLYTRAFDYADELPIRVSVLTVDGRVTHVVVCVSHLAADGWALRIVMRQLRSLIVRGVPALPPGIQPVDLTRRQAAAAGEIRRALAHWGAVWRRIPPAMFTPRQPAADVPFLRLSLDSPALVGASRLIAARQGVSPSTVLLAATIGRVAAVTGHDTCAMVVHSGNRYRSAFTTLVGTMSQKGVFALDLGDRPTFDALVRRTFLTSLTAYRNAYYDQAAVDAELAAICQQRGVEVAPHCCFNDARAITARDVTDAPPDPAEVLSALPDTRVTRTVEQPVQVDCRFCLELRDSDTKYLSVVLTADTRCLSPESMTRFLLDLEHDVVLAACGDRYPVPAPAAPA